MDSIDTLLIMFPAFSIQILHKQDEEVLQMSNFGYLDKKKIVPIWKGSFQWFHQRFKSKNSK